MDIQWNAARPEDRRYVGTLDAGLKGIWLLVGSSLGGRTFRFIEHLKREIVDEPPGNLPSTLDPAENDKGRTHFMPGAYELPARLKRSSGRGSMHRLPCMAIFHRSQDAASPL